MSLKTSTLLNAWQIPQQPPQAVPTYKAPPPPLSVPVQRELVTQAIKGTTKNWTVPTTVAPLSPQDIHFLRTHSIDDIVSRPPPTQSDNVVQKFIISFFAALAAQITVSLIHDLTHPAQEAKDSVSDRQDNSPKKDPHSSDSHHHSKHKHCTDKNHHHADHEPSTTEDSDLKNHHSPHKKSSDEKKAEKFLFKQGLKQGKAEVEKRIMDHYKETADKVAQEGADLAKKEHGPMSDSKIKALRHELRQAHMDEGKRVSGIAGDFFTGLTKAGGVIQEAYTSGRDMRDVVLHEIQNMALDKVISNGATFVCAASPVVVSKATCQTVEFIFKEFMSSSSANHNEDSFMNFRHMEDHACRGGKNLDPHYDCNSFPKPQAPSSYIDPTRVNHPGSSRYENPPFVQTEHHPNFCTIM